MSSLLVLEYTLEQIAGHADVKRVASARHDIRALNPLFHGANLHPPIYKRNLIWARLQKRSEEVRKATAGPSAPLKYAPLTMTSL
jgi:hypothetical protein